MLQQFPVSDPGTPRASRTLAFSLQPLAFSAVRPRPNLLPQHRDSAVAEIAVRSHHKKRLTMNPVESIYLDNTRKDLIGGITSVVTLVAYLNSSARNGSLDSDVRAFILRRDFEKLVNSSLAAGSTPELREEVWKTLTGLVPKHDNDYDKMSVNAELCLYAGERQLRDHFGSSDLDFHSSCLKILEKKMLDLVAYALWCRVDAYERGAQHLPIDLSEIYSAILVLVPNQYQSHFGSCADWINLAKTNWLESSAVKRASQLIDGADSEIKKVISDLSKIIA
jgi:hypothetical protein